MNNHPRKICHEVLKVFFFGPDLSKVFIFILVHVYRRNTRQSFEPVGGSVPYPHYQRPQPECCFAQPAQHVKDSPMFVPTNRSTLELLAQFTGKLSHLNPTIRGV